MPVLFSFDELGPPIRPSSVNDHSNPFTGTTVWGVTLIETLSVEDAPYLSEAVQVTKYIPVLSGAVHTALSSKASMKPPEAPHKKLNWSLSKSVALHLRYISSPPFTVESLAVMDEI